MPATGLTGPPLRELAHRTSNGTDVTLFWNERTSALTVSVRDHGTGAFQFAAEPNRALHAFYHPYAYAAARSLPRADALLASRT